MSEQPLEPTLLTRRDYLLIAVHLALALVVPSLGWTGVILLIKALKG